MRLIFEVDYELDDGEDIHSTAQLIAEELGGWSGVRSVRTRLWLDIDEEFVILNEYVSE